MHLTSEFKTKFEAQLNKICPITQLVGYCGLSAGSTIFDGYEVATKVLKYCIIVLTLFLILLIAKKINLGLALR